MKKLLLIIACLAMFAGCTKDNDVDKYALDGTKWKYVYYWQSGSYNGNVIITLDFSEEEVTIARNANGINVFPRPVDNFELTLPYTYRDKIVTIKSDRIDIVGEVGQTNITATSNLAYPYGSACVFAKVNLTSPHQRTNN